METEIGRGAQSLQKAKQLKPDECLQNDHLFNFKLKQFYNRPVLLLIFCLVDIKIVQTDHFLTNIV